MLKFSVRVLGNLWEAGDGEVLTEETVNQCFFDDPGEWILSGFSQSCFLGSVNVDLGSVLGCLMNMWKCVVMEIVGYIRFAFGLEF